MDYRSTRRHLPPALAVLQFFAAALSAVDGDPDTSFSGNGIAAWNGGADVYVSAVATSDRLAIGIGSIDLGDDGFALHWHAVDQAGNSASLGCAQATETLVTLSTSSRLAAGIVDSTGNLVVGGDVKFLGSSFSQALVARFHLTGSGCELDTSFSNSGWSVYDELFCESLQCFVVDLVEIPTTTGAVDEPRIVALVVNHTNQAKKRTALLALTSGGEIDTEFGLFGWALLSLEGAAEVDGERLARDGRGRLYVQAIRKTVSGPSTDYDEVVARFDADGGRDLDFGASGVQVLPGGTNTGTMSGVDADLEFASDGTALSAYLGDAAQFDLFGSLEGADDDWMESGLPNLYLAAQGDGRVVTASDLATDGVRLERRLQHGASDFPLDTTFGSGGRRTIDVDLGIFEAEEVDAVTLWNGRPLAVGDADSLIHSGYFLRAKSSFVFADGFEQGTPAYWSDAPGIVFP